MLMVMISMSIHFQWDFSSSQNYSSLRSLVCYCLLSSGTVPNSISNFFVQGRDYRTQFQLGNGALFGASYIQVSTLLNL